MRRLGSGDRVQDTFPSRRTRRNEGRPERSALGSIASIPIAIWFLGIIVVLLVLTVGGLWALYLLRGQWTPAGPTPTPIIWTPTPMVGPQPTAAVVAAVPEPTEIVPTVSPDIEVGGYVRVSGTGGDGLNLREGPGSNYVRKDTALEGEVFMVSAGPTEAGDIVWWKIRDPDDEARDWWAAGNYLEPALAP